MIIYRKPQTFQSDNFTVHEINLRRQAAESNYTRQAGEKKGGDNIW